MKIAIIINQGVHLEVFGLRISEIAEFIHRLF